MGSLQGYPVGDTMYIMDVYALPVVGTETRVNATQDADGYMIDHQDKSAEVNRPEFICGWYHSHPGYGCWLSGIDVNTQQTMQMMQDPAIAIVIDPKRTIAAGKVEIGCFRAYTNEYAEKKQTKSSSVGLEMIQGEKFEEFGVHSHKYYKLEHQVFKSNMDELVLERLWNEYWVHTLASSPLLHNRDHINKSVVNVVQKFNKITSTHAP